LPLAYGVGAGADMLRPLAIGVIGALVVSLALSLIATPVCYFLLSQLFAPGRLGPTATAPHAKGGAAP
jgi:Cu/Ag efflux pump CusA